MPRTCAGTEFIGCAGYATKVFHDGAGGAGEIYFEKMD
jgi:hypothetical protein